MFKCVRDFVQQPQFLIFCDGSCGTFVSAPFAAGSKGVEDQQKIAFVQTAAAQGWSIDLERQLCPAHVKKANSEESLIVVPRVGAEFPSRN